MKQNQSMKKRETNFDVIIIGAGASGLMCGISAGKRGKRVLILDHNQQAAQKIQISGGGKCNFTNYHISADHYISDNPHFVKSALSRYTQWDFLNMIHQYKIPYEEREFGQLFCKENAADIVRMLLSENNTLGTTILLNKFVKRIYKNQQFMIQTKHENFSSDSLVIATGGISWPTTGATGFGYRIAKKFNLKTRPTSPGLVPLKLSRKQQHKWGKLSGISLTAKVQTERISFQDELLFTHKGLSGPVILQLSNYWQPNQKLYIDFLPDQNITKLIEHYSGQKHLNNFLAPFLPERLVNFLINKKNNNKPIPQYNKQEIAAIASLFHQFELTPTRKASLRKAEVTLGGVDTNELSSKTFETRKIKGLFFIGEVLDVTGWLGGYNLQWAWSSGWCAGLYV